MKTPADYYSLVRHELFAFIPQGKHVILEVGCGSGATLAELKKTGRAKKTIGIEFDQAAAKLARRNVDEVIVGDLESLKLSFRSHYFDIIMFPDILEHLRDPWATLKRFRPLLKTDGRLIVSVPNIAHFTVLRDLLRGRWEYAEAGIMDRTHLRFFTRQTILRALENAGYEVQEVRTNGGKLVGWKRWLDQLSGGRISPWFVAQYLILAKPTSTS